ncbi:MAG: BREX system Lon protease-like protein BrxL [Rhabdochlamydiaceae bacterium]
MPEAAIAEKLDSKAKSAFGSYVVEKELVHSHEISRLPRFISEYLVAKFYSDGEPRQEEIKRLQDFVNIHFPELRDKDKILHDIMTKGSYTLMDEFKVETDIKGARHRLFIPCLNIRDAQVLSTILDENTDLLRSGMWGVATLKYMPQEEQSKESETSPVLMTKFTPFEVVNVRLSEFSSKRQLFTRKEWIDILVRSIGLNPNSYNDYQKMLLFLRLVPLVEANCNVLELGPKATGKTYLYRNISYSTRLISGGRVSPATLFYNIATKAVGEIGVRDCVALDEIGKLAFSNSEEMIGKLKDYMVDGFFERGPKKAHANASLVFMGNMEFGSSFSPSSSSSSATRVQSASDTVNALPLFMRDSALLDRVHCFIPGWELPKIMQSSEHLASGYGIVADYLSEVFHQMSMQGTYSDIISERVKIGSSTRDGVTIREEKAIKKVASGMLKLLCPDRKYEEQDISLSMKVAVDARQRVNALLSCISPQEFNQEKRLEFAILDSEASFST